MNFPVNLPIVISRAFFFGMIAFAAILIIEASTPFTTAADLVISLPQASSEIQEF